MADRDRDHLDDDDLTQEFDFGEETPLGTRKVTRREHVAVGAGARTAARHRTRDGRLLARDGSLASRYGAVRSDAHRRGRGRWLAAAMIVLVLAVIAAGAWFVNGLYRPFAGSPYGRVTVQVPPGTSPSAIGDILVKDHVVPSAFFFNLRARLAGDRGKLLSGTFHLRENMSYSAVLVALMTPPPAAKTTDITMTPGERRIDFSQRLAAAGVKGDYYTATLHSKVLNPTAYGAPATTPSLEGFLFPDTYQLRVPVSMTTLIDDQLTRFRQEFQTIDTSYARSQGQTPYDVLIIASLVQAEAFTAHDMPLVASVIYNRLHDGMLLGFDSTTRYATGNFTRPLTQSELASPSPWNTRNHAGLPPTPIDNPGLEAIRAAAHPPTTNLLYFVSKPCSNALAFSSDNGQFQNDVNAFNATQSQNGLPPTHPCPK